MKVKVSEATGPVLDWTVAKAKLGASHAFSASDLCIWARNNTPSTNWAQGGPIIEREEIAFGPQYIDGKLVGWEALCHKTIAWDENGEYIDDSEKNRSGPTPLIAAMRCFVASKLGNEVEVPEELL